MSLGNAGTLPAGVRPGTSEAREAGLTFGPAGRPLAQADSLGFADLLDVVNPLQHLPVVGTLYREWTGDTIAAPARILGDTLFGGPIGLLFGIIDSIVESISGKDIGGAVYAAVFGEDEAKPVVLASAAPEPTAESTAEPAERPMPDPQAAIEVKPTVPPGTPAIVGYQDALDSMSRALDQYQATQGRLYDGSY